MGGSRAIVWYLNFLLQQKAAYEHSACLVGAGDWIKENSDPGKLSDEIDRNLSNEHFFVFCAGDRGDSVE